MTTGIKLARSFQLIKQTYGNGLSPKGLQKTIGRYRLDCFVEFSHPRTGLKKPYLYCAVNHSGETVCFEVTLPDLMHDFRRKIQVFRARRREARDILQEYQDQYSHRILHLLRRKKEEAARKKRARLFEPKKPNYHTKHFGVELEFYTSEADCRNQIADKFIAAGVTDGIEVKTDGSIEPGREDRDGCAACGGCSGDCFPGCDCTEDCNCADDWNCECEHTCDRRGHGFEITVMGSESKIMKRIADTCRVLNSEAINADVNKTCGLHVHIDMRNRDDRQREIAFRNLVFAQPILYAMVPESRMLNTYCKPTGRSDLAAELDQSDRYKGINAQSLRDLRTVEIRIHTGSTNGKKIQQWVKILDLIAHGAPCLKPIRTLKELRRQYPKIKGELIEFIRERAAIFSGGNSRVMRIDGKALPIVSLS